MKSQVLVDDDPLTVWIYEEPELTDTLPWIIMTIMLFLVTGLVTFLTNSEQTVFALAVVIVVLLPFFINRFILKRGSVGGESLRVERLTDAIRYRSRKFPISDIQLVLNVSQLKHQNMYELYLESNAESYKLRSDFAKRKEQSVTFQFAIQLKSHLGLEVEENYSTSSHL